MRLQILDGGVGLMGKKRKDDILISKVRKVMHFAIRERTAFKRGIRDVDPKSRLEFQVSGKAVRTLKEYLKELAIDITGKAEKLRKHAEVKKTLDEEDVRLAIDGVI
jgi:histone H3/H4